MFRTKAHDTGVYHICISIRTSTRVSYLGLTSGAGARGEDGELIDGEGPFDL